MDAFNLNFVTSIFSSVYGTSTPEDVYYINSSYERYGVYDRFQAAREDVSHPIKFSKEENRLTLQEELFVRSGFGRILDYFSGKGRMGRLVQPVIRKLSRSGYP